jgi:two-component system, OmpR family, phosphate regulon sensor histidine kinase PhoR
VILTPEVRWRLDNRQIRAMRHNLTVLKARSTCRGFNHQPRDAMAVIAADWESSVMSMSEMAVAPWPSDTSAGISDAASGDARLGGDSEPRRQHLLRAVDFYATVLAMACHDLRQPLQVIVSTYELLARRIADGIEREHLERGEQATAELSEKLDQLVDALQLLQRTSRIEPAPVPLGPVLHHLMQQLDGPARRKGVDFRIVPTHAVAMSHAVLLDGMLRNLARNALDHTIPGGRVLIGCRQRGTTLRIEVRDDGEGIPTDKLATVFEPFFRIDTARSDGLGLGLFIVKRAADCLGHRIEVRSARYRGSCFAILARSAHGPAIYTTSTEMTDGITATR